MEELAGEMAMDSNIPAVTVNTVLELADCPLTVTEIKPVVAVEGTVTVREVAVAAETLAVTPLNCTAFEESVVLKP